MFTTFGHHKTLLAQGFYGCSPWLFRLRRTNLCQIRAGLCQGSYYHYTITTNLVKPHIMHIAIDARMYGTAQRGIGRYLMKLIENLEQVDPENKYTIFLRRANFDEYQPRNPNFKKALWDVPWYGIREQVCLSPLCHPERSEGSRSTLKGRDSSPSAQNDRIVELYHFSHWNVPLLFSRPFIVTIHDLELFSSNRTRENSTRGRVMYWLKLQAFKIVFRHAVLASRAIIVPSHFVEEQLLDLYPQVRKKVQVIYEAPTIEIQNVKCKIKNEISVPYILYIGAAYPHKNLPRLLEAWALVHKELPDYQLVLVGREDWFWRKLKEQFHNPPQPSLTLREGDRSEPTLKVRGGRGSYETHDGILFSGQATDAELSTLYKNAALLVQPSLEEGFSLSPLEALSHGTPVAVSDIPVHREILSNAAFFFNPQSVPMIAETIVRALTNAEARTTVMSLASAQIYRYSWGEHARQTRDLYAAVHLV